MLRSLIASFCLLLSISVFAVEQKMVGYTISLLEQQKAGLNSILESEEALGRDTLMVQNIIAASQISSLIEKERMLLAEKTIEKRHGVSEQKTYSYTKGHKTVYSDKMLEIEARLSSNLAPIFEILPNFPLLLMPETVTRIKTKKLYSDLESIFKRNGVSLSKLNALRLSDESKLADFLLVLFERNKPIYGEIVAAFKREASRASDIIDESIEELRENGVGMIIHNQDLVNRYWEENFMSSELTEMEFHAEIARLRGEFPLEENMMTRMVLGSGLLLTGIVTSFTGVSLGLIGTGAIILTGGTLAVLDGIESHRMFERHQVNSGLYISQMVSNEEYLEAKKRLQTNLAFNAIDVIAAPFDIFTLVKLGKVRFAAKVKHVKAAPEISAFDDNFDFAIKHTKGEFVETVAEGVKKFNDYDDPAVFFKEHNVDFEIIKEDGKDVYRILPTNSSHLNKYVLKNEKLVPSVRFVYVEGEMTPWAAGMYSDYKRSIFLGGSTFDKIETPLFYDGTIAHELMHARFYHGLRNFEADYSTKIFAKFRKIQGAGNYKDYMNTQESHTYSKSIKNTFKKFMMEVRSADEISDISKMDSYNSVNHYSRSAIDFPVVAGRYYSRILDELNSLKTQQQMVDYVSAHQVDAFAKKTMKKKFYPKFKHDIDDTEAYVIFPVYSSNRKMTTYKGAEKIIDAYKNYLERQIKRVNGDRVYAFKMHLFTWSLYEAKSKEQVLFHYNMLMDAMQPHTTYKVHQKSKAYKLFTKNFGLKDSPKNEVSAADRIFTALKEGEKSEVVIDGVEAYRFILGSDVVDTTMNGQLINFYPRQ